MPNVKINVKSIIEESKIIHAELKEGIATAQLSKTDKQALISEIEEAIAIAKSIKVDFKKKLK